MQKTSKPYAAASGAGRHFSEVWTILCARASRSENFMMQQKRLSQAMADIKHGQKRIVQSLEDARDEYRNKVLAGHIEEDSK